MNISEVQKTDPIEVLSPELTQSNHCLHDKENICMKLCIASFELQFVVDQTTDNAPIWQAVFYLKDLSKLKSDEISDTLTCAAKSLFKLLYFEADCRGNPAISFRIMQTEMEDIDQGLSQLFILSLMDGMDESSSIDRNIDKAISHSYAYLTKDQSKGTLYFDFNDPQEEQITKIMLLLTNLFPIPTPVEESWCSYM